MRDDSTPSGVLVTGESGQCACVSGGEATFREVRSLCVDPLNPCAPIGAMYAAFGVHGGLPLSHGASGCCRFQRMELAKHFQKTVHVPSTLLRDRAAMFGGEAEVQEAVENVFRLYDPEVLVISTTCLSETIGDDMGGIVERLKVPPNKAVVWASTPGYAGSQLAGFDATVAALIRRFDGSAERTPTSTNRAAVVQSEPVKEAGSAPADMFVRECDSPEAGPAGRASDTTSGGLLCESRLCLLPGWMNPCDVGIAVSLAEALFDEVTVLPDVRDVFDRKTPDDPTRYAPGGTPREAIEGIGSCACAVALGREATEESVRAVCEAAPSADVVQLPQPIGIAATDRLIAALAARADRPVPAWIAEERTRLIDCLMQVADQIYGKRVLVCCDADLACAVASFAVDVGMVPSCIAVGDALPDFEEHVRTEVALPGACVVLAGADRLAVEEHVAAHPIDIVLGDTRNKRLAARAGVPLVRIGFPVVDRPLSYTEPIAGYPGALSLLRRIVEAFCEQEERGKAPEDLSISRYF
ncbi:nitrogenase component 1 [Raoultibacter phocaeensis]|uniref:nitrogenase component 1 n=1 Tax=Raoultibacter phocaeensis TaxID=2479841 RepID=UPI00111A6266|nr:nitrogenase component 1 [Raoultibacter phocaeensis]